MTAKLQQVQKSSESTLNMSVCDTYIQIIGIVAYSFMTRNYFDADPAVCLQEHGTLSVRQSCDSSSPWFLMMP